MKKKVIVTSIIGFVLMAAGILLWMLMGTFIQGVGPAGAQLNWNFYANLLSKLGNLLKVAYTPVFTVPAIVMIAVCGLMLILWIVHLILIIKKKRGPAVVLLIVFLVEIAATYLALTLFFLPGLGAAFGSDLGPFGWLLNNVPTVGVMPFLGFLVGPILFLIGWIIALVGLISDLVLLSTLPKPVKPGDPVPDEVVVIRDGEPVPQPMGSGAGPEAAYGAPGQPGPCGGQPAPAPQPAPMQVPAAGIQGPILVQYINTYAPEARGQAGVPVSEIQGAITGEKPLSAEEIRKIIKEEMAGKEAAPQPVIVNVPAPVEPAPEPKPQPKGLTAEEVRAIFSEELDRYLGQEVPEQEEEDFPEGADADIIVEEDEDDTLTADDVRQLIADSFADMKKEEEPTPAEEKPESLRDIVREELAAARAAEAAEKQKKLDEEEAAKQEAERLEAAKKEAVEEALRQREEEEAAKEEEPKPIGEEDIRAIIAEELAKAAPEQAQKPEDIAALIRETVRAALAENKPVQEERVEPAVVRVEEAAPAPMPTVNIIVKQEEAPAPAPEPEPEPEPAPEPAAEEPKEKIVRIPFPTRMLDADKELKSNYNELKSEILSYGVKSRVSNTGDTFRLHKVTFVKITIAGKALKLYFALNPADYASTTYPIQDAGHKGTYKDIPLVFKVKSELSLRRAKQLIADVMEKNDLEQGKIEPHNWAAELKDYKPAGSDDED